MQTSDIEKETSFIGDWDEYDDLLAFDESYTSSIGDGNSSVVNSGGGSDGGVVSQKIKTSPLTDNALSSCKDDIQESYPSFKTKKDCKLLLTSKKTLKNGELALKSKAFMSNTKEINHCTEKEDSKLLQISDNANYGKLTVKSEHCKLSNTTLTAGSLGLDSTASDLIAEGESLLIYNMNSISSVQQYENAKKRLDKFKISILERFYFAFDAIPRDILQKLPGFDMCVNDMLKNLYNGIGHNISLMENMCWRQNQLNNIESPKKNKSLEECHISKLFNTVGNKLSNYKYEDCVTKVGSDKYLSKITDKEIHKQSIVETDSNLSDVSSTSTEHEKLSGVDSLSSVKTGSLAYFNLSANINSSPPATPQSPNVTPVKSSAFKFKMPSSIKNKSHQTPRENSESKTLKSPICTVINHKKDDGSELKSSFVESNRKKSFHLNQNINCDSFLSPIASGSIKNRLARPLFQKSVEKSHSDINVCGRENDVIELIECTEDVALNEKDDSYCIEPASPEKKIVGDESVYSVPFHNPSSSQFKFANHEEQNAASKTGSNDFALKRKLSSPSSSSVDTNYIGKFSSNIKNDGISGQFDGTKFPHSKEMLKIFRETFGLHSFRPCQLQAINAILLQHDCFILMPTGGGKSLCYQLPAMISPGVTIVVSPLKSLILDQVQKLKSLDIPAARLSGDPKEEHDIYLNLSRRETRLKLIYVTPEKLVASDRCVEMLQNLYLRNQIARFVIDEVHCVSQWGHDFRPDYKKLNELRRKFPKVPIVALTATATERVRADILHQLGLRQPKWFICSFNRPNLQYEVLEKKPKTVVVDAISLIKNKFPRDCGIIYCLSQKECENTTKELNKVGLKAGTYHGGLPDKERAKVQMMWLSNKIKIVCATIAFGMGIDKPDVRFVIHLSLPKSVEGLYQEAGRAGRDGKSAQCVLFYNYCDVYRHRRLIEGGIQKRWDSGGPFIDPAVKTTHLDNLSRIVAYCQNRTECRRVLQLHYFGEIYKKSECIKQQNTCDNCLNSNEFQETDFTKEAQEIVRCFSNNRLSSRNVTIIQLVDIIKGSQNSKLKTLGYSSLSLFGLGKLWNKEDVSNLLRQLVLKGVLQEELVITKADTAAAYLRLGPKANSLLDNKYTVKLSTRRKTVSTDIGLKVSSDSENQFTVQLQEIQEKCYTELMDICQGIAASLGVGTSSIMNVQAIKFMSEVLPETEPEMLKIPHVTTANFEKFGKPLLDVTIKYAVEKFIVLEQQSENQKESSIATSENENDSEDDVSGFVASSSFNGNKRKRPGASSRPVKRRRKTGSKGFKNKGYRSGGRGRGFSGSNSTSSSQVKGRGRAQSSTGVKGPGFLPMATPSKFPPSKRPGFLPQPKVYTL